MLLKILKRDNKRFGNTHAAVVLLLRTFASDISIRKKLPAFMPLLSSLEKLSENTDQYMTTEISRVLYMINGHNGKLTDKTRKGGTISLRKAEI